MHICIRVKVRKVVYCQRFESGVYLVLFDTWLALFNLDFIKLDLMLFLPADIKCKHHDQGISPKQTNKHSSSDFCRTCAFWDIWS